MDARPPWPRPQPWVSYWGGGRRELASTPTPTPALLLLLTEIEPRRGARRAPSSSPLSSLRARAFPFPSPPPSLGSRRRGAGPRVPRERWKGRGRGRGWNRFGLGSGGRGEGVPAFGGARLRRPEEEEGVKLGSSRGLRPPASLLLLGPASLQAFIKRPALDHALLSAPAIQRKGARPSLLSRGSPSKGRESVPPLGTARRSQAEWKQCRPPSSPGRVVGPFAMGTTSPRIAPPSSVVSCPARKVCLPWTRRPQRPVASGPKFTPSWGP
ncbi:uncharacterized protein [Notamacropus eugenii]|uniref:uncharacterized protein n=1 Tax=Notamacropus eugenii TaxID=9315 RepID=UPI003B677AFB